MLLQQDGLKSLEKWTSVIHKDKNILKQQAKHGSHVPHLKDETRDHQIIWTRTVRKELAMMVKQFESNLLLTNQLTDGHRRHSGHAHC